MERSKLDFKIFIPIGISFCVIGIVLSKRSPAIGLTFLGLGISWIAIGKAKSKNKNDGGEK